MYYKVLLQSFLFLCIVSCTTGVNQIQNGDSRISEGNDAEIEKYPYVAFLEINRANQMSSCGGSIISRRYIITSAFCLEGADIIKVRIGSTYSNSGGFEYVTQSFTQHPSYNNDTREFDIGIVNIEEGMTLDGEHSSTINLPAIGTDVRNDETITILGWGATDADGTEPNLELQMGKTSVITRRDCRKTVRGVTRRMFCAQGNANICKGDYGGPAVGQQRVLNGVASYGPKCGEEAPGVYTRVGDALIRSFISVSTGV